MKNIAVLCAAVASLGLTVATSDAAIVYATSFESPTFVAGPIAGQDSWMSTAGAGNVMINTGAAIARTGTQYAFYNTANATNAAPTKFSWKPINLSAAALAPTPILTATVWAGMATSASDRTAVTGLDLYNIAGDRIAAINFANDGTVNPLDPVGAVTITTPVTASLGSYHKLQMMVNFADQSIKYFFDNTLFATSTATTATDFGDADIYSIRTSNPAGSSGGWQLAWDDLSIVTSPVPEPTGVAPVAPLALAALSRRRR